MCLRLSLRGWLLEKRILPPKHRSRTEFQTVPEHPRIRAAAGCRRKLNLIFDNRFKSNSLSLAISTMYPKPAFIRVFVDLTNTMAAIVATTDNNNTKKIGQHRNNPSLSMLSFCRM